MNSKPAKHKDRNVFASLVKAQKAGFVAIEVNASRLNHPGSPVWDAGINAAPILGMLLISIALFLAVNVLVGLAFAVLSVLIFVFFLRPWILQRVSRTALNAALENIHNWNLIWDKGGLVISVVGAKKVRCASPAADWRDFAARHIPQINLDGINTYTTFNRAGGNDTGAETLEDYEM